jgi:hypothetical protein
VSGCPTTSPGEVRRCERHLVACELCRQEVASERRLQRTLRRTDPAVPRDLRSLLLSVQSSGTEVDDRPHPDGVTPLPGYRGSGGILWPVARAVEVVETASSPRHHGTAPLPVLSPQAPACHRSALRSALLATAAAGVSAAAAWSIGVGVTAASSVPGDFGSEPQPGSTAHVEQPPTTPDGPSGPASLAGTLVIWTGDGVTPAAEPSSTASVSATLVTEGSPAGGETGGLAPEVPPGAAALRGVAAQSVP